MNGFSIRSTFTANICKISFASLSSPPKKPTNLCLETLNIFLHDLPTSVVHARLFLIFK